MECRVTQQRVCDCQCNLEMPTDVSVWENTDCLARAARVCQAGHGRTGRTGSQGSHALPGGRQNMKPMFHLASPVQNLTESRLAL